MPILEKWFKTDCILENYENRKQEGKVAKYLRVNDRFVSYEIFRCSISFFSFLGTRSINDICVGRIILYLNYGSFIGIKITLHIRLASHTHCHPFSYSNRSQLFVYSYIVHAQHIAYHIYSHSHSCSRCTLCLLRMVRAQPSLKRSIQRIQFSR